MTTQTTTVSALPHGGFRLRESLLPVRVRQAVRRNGRLVRQWVPVSTVLRRAGGVLRPVAVPGDQVAISAGGAGPLVSLSQGTKRLALRWPGRLPVPVVSGASATYSDVRPGIDLVVTATSQQAGGFWVTLVIKDQAAVRELPSRGLALAMVTRGDGFVGQPVTTWDSGRLPERASRSQVSAASRAARLAGAVLAQPGSGLGGGSGPLPGALVAQASGTVGGRALVLVPAAGILRSGSARYPLSVGTEFTARPPATAATLPVPDTSADKGTQAYDVLKQACPTSQVEVPDSTSPTYAWLGTGYDGWGDDCAGSNGYVYADFQFGVPTKIDGSTISSAAGQDSGVHAWETWSADCVSSANVTASWAGQMDGDTDWSNTAGRTVTDLVTTSVGPDTSASGTNCGSGTPTPTVDQNCSQTQPGSCPNYLPVFFKLPAGDGSMLQKAADGSWSNVTIRLWEKDNAAGPQGSGGTNKFVWKKFSNNPYLEIFYDHSPDMPTGGQISDGGSFTGCLQNNAKNYPRVGHEPSGGGVTAQATFKDRDGDSMNGTFQYKLDSSSTWITAAPGANPQPISPDGHGSAIIPPSFTNGNPDGTVVDWRAQADDGATDANGGQGNWSGTCHFKVFGTAPPEPTISANSAPTCPSGTIAGTIVPGCAVSFTIKSNDAAGDPAAEFVWTMDQDPPDATPPSGEVISLSSGQTSANVTVTIPTPGPHALYAYVIDQAAVNSKPGVSPPLSPVAGNDPASVPPFDTFSTALGKTASWDNQMISSASGSPGTADGDGSGDAIDENVLKQAGWKSGGTVTIDGATFTLPHFGAANEADNILAAGQTFAMPSNSQGTSLVFLATSTNATAAAPLANTASYPGGDRTVPYVPGGSPVTGLQCDEYQSAQSGGCQIPLGDIGYTSGGSQQYYLTVPDWITGPASEAAVELAGGWDNPGGVSQAAPNIYAFSVPINPNDGIATVTLPDIGASVSAVPGVSPGGGLPGLHIFGIAVANTTTATPGLASSGLPQGQTWTAAWASPSEALLWTPTGTGWGGSTSGQTIRTVMTVASGGPEVRLRLSDDLGWYLGAAGPLKIGAVSVAQGNAGALTGPISSATFNGSGSVNIPEGGDAYSDPIPITVTAGEKLAVSIYLTGTYSTLVENTLCNGCTTYVTANNGGDQTQVPGTSAFGTGNQLSSILTSLDVETSGVPTVAVLGDNVIDEFSVSDIPATSRLSDDLASELISAAGSGGQPPFSVVSEGIQGNGLLSESLQLSGGGPDTSGPSAATRLAEDVLSEPNVGTVVVNVGLEDLLNGEETSTLGSTAKSLVNIRFPILVEELRAWGITPVITTLTPCAGYSTSFDACTTTGMTNVENQRVSVVNSGLRDNAPTQTCPSVRLPAWPLFDDLDNAVGDSNSPEALLNASPSNFDAGDHANLTRSGFTALAGVFPPSFCQFHAVVPPQN